MQGNYQAASKCQTGWRPLQIICSFSFLLKMLSSPWMRNKVTEFLSHRLRAAAKPVTVKSSYIYLKYSSVDFYDMKVM